MDTVKQFDGVSAIALILIASFAIDRVVTAVLFLLGWVGWAPDPAVNERKYKAVYFLLGGALGMFVLAHFGQVRVLTALGIKIDQYLDTALTGIVLVGGADRIAGLLKVPSGTPQSVAPPPMVITGKLVLEESTAQKVLGHHS